jgi:hypothetical protein
MKFGKYVLLQAAGRDARFERHSAGYAAAAAPSTANRRARETGHEKRETANSPGGAN